jgi:hypothetical protein
VIEGSELKNDGAFVKAAAEIVGGKLGGKLSAKKVDYPDPWQPWSLAQLM